MTRHQLITSLRYRRSRRVEQQRAGLSLLEVMIATGIVTASAVLLTSLISTGADLALRAEQRAEALMLCQNRIAEFQLADSTDRAEGEQSGVCPESEDWSYRLDVQPVELNGTAGFDAASSSDSGQRSSTQLLKVIVEVFPSQETTASGFSRASGGDSNESRATARLVKWIRVRVDATEQVSP